VKSTNKLCAAALSAACIAALSALAPGALADTFTLHISAPSSVPVGKPMLIQASGTDPTDQGALYLEIDAIPASVTTTCPSGYLDGSQLATSTGGDLVAFDQRENFDASGNFSTPVGYTPKSAQKILFCAYTDDGATDTLATSSTIVSVGAAAKKPANTKKPRITRVHNTLMCGRGSWSNSPRSFAYAWLVDGKVKHGARRSKLTVSHSMRGDSVRCRVTASNQAGSASSLSAAFKVH
jgi:hypothetical protein